MRKWLALGASVACALVVAGAGCGSSNKDIGFTDPDAGDEGGLLGGDSSFGGGDGSKEPSGDPKTCDEAAQMKSYIGCDYWPTVVANNVWSIFDFAVVVANAGNAPADVTITGPNGTSRKATVPAQQLAKVYLPWVTDLKGPDFDCVTSAAPLTSSVFAAGGAYHLVSSIPVTVYQFNALEYKGAGGPSGKSWSACPGLQCGGDCLSYSNDASLLLPSTAMTGNYFVAGIQGWSTGGQDVMGSYFAVTATADGTNVNVKVSGTGQVAAGGKIQATGPGGIVTFTLNAGDVAEIVGPAGAAHDLSGSQVQADKPVQVITGIPCVNVPAQAGTCDHVEESSFPAETLGKHYVVTVPTGPRGTAVGHVVRIYGTVNGTKLTGAPSTCAGTVNAGQVIDCGVINADFEITGDNPFSIGSFMLGNSIVDPNQATNAEGDPSQSQVIAVEQYRTKYIFLAPDDYDVSYVDLVAKPGTNVTLDGVGLAQSFKAVASSSLGVARVKLGAGQAGAHVITGDQPFGIQVIGYGRQTSYQYPGGLDLHAIAAPPPPVK